MHEVNRVLGVAKGDFFSLLYPMINEQIFKHGNNSDSRNGNTVEYLNWKTEILSPRYRCVGGNNRDMNIFFLLAEAMWIWTGRRDVGFLDMFNSNMKQFSDDGKVFHAPYGFRMRHFGRHSDSNEFDYDTDQFEEAIKMLMKDPETRRCVIQIWNADLDLNTDSKDLPCNDLVMLQQRGGKLHMTINNRSNDLHWGLPTNVFQFSFILECLCACLDMKMGTQTHNSKSLHIYLNSMSSKIAERMLKAEETHLYEGAVRPLPFDFKFNDEPMNETYPLTRLHQVDITFKTH